MSSERLDKAEEAIAHLTRTVEDLSDVVARQTQEIERLKRQAALLMERAAEAEAMGGGTIPLADQKPPHW
ncbi:SlyX family protein [Frigidibacter sp. RF13]|uniref:SlyX family protein n=1 Tax=Frigidibacter sp. RF13 TaxID=2997340 RepID=UPI00226F74D4|nr:SlyX family protein [Frigidibacter sp. RF13]MCY1127983.1 SlyX family protein [Frigidibacter sp. RF13]